MKLRKTKGLTILIIGLACLILSLFINRYIEINDIYCIILMLISLAVEIVGLLKIIKDTN